MKVESLEGCGLMDPLGSLTCPSNSRWALRTSGKPTEVPPEATIPQKKTKNCPKGPCFCLSRTLVPKTIPRNSRLWTNANGPLGAAPCRYEVHILQATDGLVTSAHATMVVIRWFVSKGVHILLQSRSASLSQCSSPVATRPATKPGTSTPELAPGTLSPVDVGTFPGEFYGQCCQTWTMRGSGGSFKYQA